MGMREQPITNRMKYGRLRRYKCRKCGRTFKDYHLQEEERVCPKCAEAITDLDQKGREYG